MSALYRKELKCAFANLSAPILISALLLLQGLFFSLFQLISASSNFSATFSALGLCLAVVMPILGMKSLAEDRKTHADQLLFSLPLRSYQIVLAKYFALLTVFLLPTLLFALAPVLLSFFGTVNFGSFFTCWIGYVCLGCALLAVSVFFSSLTESPVIALILSILLFAVNFFFSEIGSLLPASALFSFLALLLFALVILILFFRESGSFNLTLIGGVLLILPICVLYAVKPTLFAGLIPDFLLAADLQSRLSAFLSGRLELSGILLYLSVTALFLALSVRALAKRRWN